ncbi:CDGSH iron-sulfur domain-containing protein [Streptomyces sp. NPDC086023]|uniref:CDGSH iron-sulfur domain-containing protein n=1 Tax=Streptomyces sp. NPDC086023 TaxID=3365746 RepID=UPI0037CEF449
MAGTPEMPETGGVGSERGAPVCRVRFEPGGPVLLEGPVEVVMPDGSVAASDRFAVALCTCRRTRTPPWCDTSHRRRRRAPARAAAADPEGKESER